MGTARVKIRGQNGIEIITRALCDNGSQVNLITKAVVQQLREKPLANKTTFVGVGGNTLGSSFGELQLTIYLKDGGCMVNNFFVVKNITNYHPSVARNRWSHLNDQLADKEFNKPGKIHALLGVSSWIKLIEPEILRSNDGNSIAHKTKLGYVILENPQNPYQIEQPCIGAVARGPSIKKLMELMQRLWAVEEVPPISKRTKEEEICEEIFLQTHRRDQHGRYIVHIPFNDQLSKLGRSKKMAMNQFFAMERKMKKNPDFAERYKLFMEEYELLGHMEPIYETTESGYYVPHHGVLSSSKFRVVFNGSAKTSTGISINDTQLVGEKCQRDLFEILMNFRQYKYGITADIEKMYRQVWVCEAHRKYQKIFWRNDETKPLQVYQLKTVTYGYSCAPHCAIRALKQCAMDHKMEYPIASKTTEESFFVDDLLTGEDKYDKLDATKEEMTSLLHKGGFSLKKWRTNGEFREHIDVPEGEEHSILGLCWNLTTDQFFYKLRDTSETTNEMIWTKRKILSKIGKLYDPNGYLGPVIMAGKMVIQNLWRDKLDWDEEVKGELKKDWNKFNSDLKNINLISINRWLGTVGKDRMQIHGFCDASESGYGAVAYARVRNGRFFRTEIIASKSRVAPIKTMTIPRLELCAANLLAKLMKTIAPLFQRNEKKN